MRSSLLLAVLLLVCASQVEAALIVEGTATPIDGGLFHFEIAVTNDTAYDFVLVSIVDAPLGDPSISGTLATPVGFLGNYDSGLGIIDFLGDTDHFAAGTVTSGFAFDSVYGPGTGYFENFEALDVNGGLVTGQIEVTTVPAPIPEPTSIALFAAGGLLVGSAVRRRI